MFLSCFIIRGKCRRESNAVSLPANYLPTDPWKKPNIPGIKLAIEVSISEQLCHIKRQENDKEKRWNKEQVTIVFLLPLFTLNNFRRVLLMLRMHGLMV